MELVLAAGAGILLGAAGAVAYGRWTTTRWRIRQRVFVNTRSGRAFSGILYERRGPLLVLRGASLMEGTEAKPVDGELVIERENIDFMQVIR